MRIAEAAIIDCLDLLTDPPPRRVPWFPKTQRTWRRNAPRQPRFPPPGSLGPRLSDVDTATGRMRVEFRFFLPRQFGAQLQIRGAFTGRRWVAMEGMWDDYGVWCWEARSVRPGDWYEFRYRDPQGHWRTVTDPMAYRYTKRYDAEAGGYDQYAVIPDLGDEPDGGELALNQPLSILECTFPGLLANWAGGAYFPRPQGRRSFAELLLHSGLIEHLRANQFNAIRLPLQAAVADLLQYEWRYSYLLSGPGAIDSQIGDWGEVRALVDAFSRAGILVIPDLVLVHHAKAVSRRALDQLYTPDAGYLWFDRTAYHHRDYGTHLYDLRQPLICQQLVDMLVRFVCELNLSALRLDYVDGLMLQYQNAPQNYGAQFVADVKAALDMALRTLGREVLVICAAFDTRWAPAVRELAGALDQPWVGFEAVERLLTLPQNGRWRLFTAPLVDALNRAAGIDGPLGGVFYALSHAEAAGDEGVKHDRDYDGRRNCVGGHLAQLVLNQGKALRAVGQLADRQLLDFVARRTAMIEAITMFAADYAYMNLGGFSDFLKLGSYDDRDGWQSVWSAARHPDLAQWQAATGLSAAAVRARLTGQAALMRGLRQIFLTHTPVDLAPPPDAAAGRYRPVSIRTLASIEETATLAFVRDCPARPELSLILGFNFGLQDVPSFRIPLPDHLRGAWQIRACIPARGTPDAPGARLAATADPTVLDVALPGNAMILLGRPATAGPSAETRPRP